LISHHFGRMNVGEEMNVLEKRVARQNPLDPAPRANDGGIISRTGPQACSTCGPRTRRDAVEDAFDHIAFPGHREQTRNGCVSRSAPPGHYKSRAGRKRGRIPKREKILVDSVRAANLDWRGFPTRSLGPNSHFRSPSRSEGRAA